MKKLFASAITIQLSIALGVLSLGANAGDGYSYQQLGVSSVAQSGLTVTLDSISIVPKAGSTQLVVSYTQKNNTSDKKLDEGSFKLFFTDGTSEAQYGAFNSFFPDGGNTRSYTWEWLNGKEPWLIEWEAGFFAKTPTNVGLKWKIGTSYPAATPVATPVPSDTTAAPSPAAKTPVPVKYKNCSALNKVYTGGVAKSAKWVNKGGKIKQKPTLNAKTYNLNKGLDRDKDGIACER
jgi:hypothetical protein